jgi:hypothetical protein
MLDGAASRAARAGSVCGYPVLAAATWVVHLKRDPLPGRERRRVVKGVEFVDIRDAGDPVELAAHYDREGRRAGVLDITATHGRRDDVALAPHADEVFVPFTIGGGIRSVVDAQAVLDAGRTRYRSTRPPWPVRS